MDVQVELIHRRHGYRKEIVLVRRIDEDLRAAFELALRGFLDQDQRAAIGRVLDDRIGVPGDIGGGVAQEIVVTQLRPELLGIIRVGAMARRSSRAARWVWRICSRPRILQARSARGLRIELAQRLARQEFHSVGLVALISATVARTGNPGGSRRRRAGRSR